MINVSGSGEVKVAPNEIYLRVGVETRNETLEEARKQSDDRVSKALAFLKSKGVLSKDIQTDFISIEPMYENDVLRMKPSAYIARKSLEVKLVKVDSFESVMAGLLASGMDNVQGVEFRTSELRKHRDTARSMAIRAAREKADALASDLGVKRGKVYNISANEWGGSWNPAGNWGGKMMQNVVQNAGGDAGSTETSLSLGQISVSATVNVSFLIE
jgi:uncharacterized protein YggE